MTGCALMPFVAIIIGAHVAWQIHHDDGYTQQSFDHSFYKASLKVVGEVKAGLDFIRIPNIRFPMGKFLADCVPLTLIAYMESYSVARRIAAQRNELHILSASQEMWGNGVANLLASICSAYPVSGSFSRSSLNYASGARTAISSLVVVCVISLALGSLTKVLYYIPNAALAAIIFLAISNLINFTEFWEAFRHSKKDFFIMIVTAVVVFVFDTSTGLAVGIGCSIIVLLGDTVLGRRNVPWVVKSRQDNDGVDVVKLESDINFLNAHRIKDFICGLFIQAPPVPDTTSSINERYYFAITSALDRVLRPDVLDGVEDIPKAIIIDFSVCRMLDLTGLKVLSEILAEGRAKKVKYVIIHIHPELVHHLKKFGIKNDCSSDDCYLDPYIFLSSLETRKPAPQPPVNAEEITDLPKDGEVVANNSRHGSLSNDVEHGDDANVVSGSSYKVEDKIMKGSVGTASDEGVDNGAIVIEMVPSKGYDKLPTSETITEKDR
jgi:MFS superfamily sulfate permease-like transporter